MQPTTRQFERFLFVLIAALTLAADASVVRARECVFEGEVESGYLRIEHFAGARPIVIPPVDDVSVQTSTGVRKLTCLTDGTYKSVFYHLLLRAGGSSVVARHVVETQDSSAY